MKCSYCIQGGHENRIEPKISNNEIKELVKLFPKSGTCELVYFGGEPLLYWDYIVRFTEEIKEHNPNILISTVSNGLLLTKERAKKLNEIGVHFKLSHDGPFFEQARGIKDILITNPEPYLMLEKRGISATASKFNYNFYDIWGYFNDFVIKHGLKKKETVYIKHIEDADNNTSEKLFIYNMPEFEAMLDKVFFNMEKQILSNNFNEYEFQQYARYFYSLNYRIQDPLNRICAMCGGDRCAAHIDVRGNIYRCHNVEEHYTTVKKEGVILPGNYNPYINTTTCIECPAYILCGGGCCVCDESKKKYSCYVTQQEFSRLIGLLGNIERKLQ